MQVKRKLDGAHILPAGVFLVPDLEQQQVPLLRALCVFQRGIYNHPVLGAATTAPFCIMIVYQGQGFIGLCYFWQISI